MGYRRELLIVALAAACVSTDFTTGLPCNRDEQCGGGERCENGYCGGSPSSIGASASAGSSSATAAETGGVDEVSDGSSSSGGCPVGQFGCDLCDPLAQNCPGNAGCYARSDSTTECVDLFGDGRATDQCAYPFDETCAPGFVCSPFMAFESCPDDLAFCCFQLCNLSAPDCNAGICTALWYTPQHQEVEHLGYCQLEAP